MLAGAVAFWLPDVVWHAIRQYKFGTWDAIEMNILMPLSLLGMYVHLRRRTKESTRFVGWPLILGVWCLGGLFVMMGATFTGGGFSDPNCINDAVTLILALTFLPLFLIDAATYDASLPALILVTVIALVILLWRRRSTRPNSPI